MDVVVARDVYIGPTMRAQRPTEDDNRLMLRPSDAGTPAAHTLRFVNELAIDDVDIVTAEMALAYADIRAFIEGGRPLFVPNTVEPASLLSGSGAAHATGRTSHADDKHDDAGGTADPPKGDGNNHNGVRLTVAKLQKIHGRSQHQKSTFVARAEWRELLQSLSTPSPLTNSYSCGVANLLSGAARPDVSMSADGVSTPTNATLLTVKPPLFRAHRDAVLARAAERQGLVPAHRVGVSTADAASIDDDRDRAIHAPRIPPMTLQVHGYAVDNAIVFSGLRHGTLSDLNVTSTSRGEDGAGDGMSVAAIDAIGQIDAEGAVMFELDRKRERVMATRMHSRRRKSNTQQSPSAAGSPMSVGSLASSMSPTARSTTPTASAGRRSTKAAASGAASSPSSVTAGGSSVGLHANPTLGELWTSVRGIIFRLRFDRCDAGHQLYYCCVFAPLFTGRDITLELARFVRPVDTPGELRREQPPNPLSKFAADDPRGDHLTPLVASCAKPPASVAWLATQSTVSLTQEEWAHVDNVFALFTLHFDVVGVLDDGVRYW